jgi:hypothetical protein
MRLWHSGRAALYGAIVGVLAATFRLFGPWSEPHTAAANIGEIVGAALAFALLCAGAAALRNLIARRLLWREGR